MVYLVNISYCVLFLYMIIFKYSSQFLILIHLGLQSLEQIWHIELSSSHWAPLGLRINYIQFFAAFAATIARINHTLIVRFIKHPHIITRGLLAVTLFTPSTAT